MRIEIFMTYGDSIAIFVLGISGCSLASRTRLIYLERKIDVGAAEYGQHVSLPQLVAVQDIKSCNCFTCLEISTGVRSSVGESVVAPYQ